MDNMDTNDLLLQSSDEEKGKKDVDNVKTKVSLQDTLFYTDALSENNINDIITTQRPELFVLFGLNDVGKTTFVGSLYHQLRIKGNMAEFEFVDSDTFAGLERRVFLRKCSKDGRSDTNRTTRSENPFLTLHMEHKITGRRLIVLSDRAGERYYISKNEELVKDKTIKYANRLLLFINAEELSGRPYSNMKDEFKMLLHRLKEKDMLPFNATKYIIFNKYDKVGDPENHILKDHEQEIINIIDEIFENEGIPQYRINSKDLDQNKELEELFSIIIKPLKTRDTDLALDWVNASIKNNK